MNLKFFFFFFSPQATKEPSSNLSCSDQGGENENKTFFSRKSRHSSALELLCFEEAKVNII